MVAPKMAYVLLSPVAVLVIVSLQYIRTSLIVVPESVYTYNRLYWWFLSPSLDPAHHYCAGGGPSLSINSETKEPS